MHWHWTARTSLTRWDSLETLASRASTHQGSVKKILEAKLGAVTVAFQARFEQAKSERQQTLATPTPAEPRETLRGLVHLLAQDRSAPVVGAAQAHIDLRPELRAVRNFRNTWSKLSVNKQVNQALTQAPKNAGPLNSHRVALRSLALMRDTSPDYLNRFMSYVDTLLCLDQGEPVTLSSGKIPAASDSGKKPKAPRRQTK